MKYLLLISLSLLSFINLSAQLEELLKIQEAAQSEVKENNLTACIQLYEVLYEKAISYKNDSLREEACYQLYQQSYYLNEFYSSINYVQTELKFVEKNNPKNEEYIAYLNGRLAFLYNNVGDIMNSSKCYSKTEYIKIHNVKYFFESLAQGYSTVLAQLADYESAINLQKQALSYFTDSLKLENMAESMNNLGEYFLLKGDLIKAAEYHNMVLNSEHNYRNYDLANAYSGLGEIHLVKDENSQAFEYFKLALETNKSIDKNSDLNQIQKLNKACLMNVANYHSTQNDFDSAFTYIKKAKELYLSFGQSARELAKIYIKEGQILYKLKKYDSAKTSFNKAIEFLSKYETDVQFLPAYLGLCKIDFNNLESDFTEQKAIELLDKIDVAFSYYTSIRQNHRADESIINLTDFVKSFSSIGVYTCYQLFENTEQQKYAQKALVLMENTRSSALYKSVSLANINSDDSLSLSRKRLRNEIHHLKIHIKSSNLEKEKMELAKKNLSKLEFELSLLAENNNTEFEQAIQYDDFSSIINDQNKSILYYYWNSELEEIYLIENSDQTLTFNLLSDYKIITDGINEIKKSLTFENRHNFDIDLSFQLCQRLVPVGLLKKQTLVIPDGPLSQIPFEVLSKENSQFLVESTDIFYASSLSILNLQKNLNTECSQSVAAFAPIFKDDEKLFLSESQKEISNIASLIQTDLFEFNLANSDQFINQDFNYSVIHLSTHASSSAVSEDSYIHFNDRKLMLEELYSISLKNQLVVLSACETGTGKLSDSEGVMSLSRGFNYAGIPSVISSLWSVNESSTSNLVERVYEKLTSGSTISQSLANSKREYLGNSSINPELKTPFYWAGLVHYGADSKIELNKKPAILKTVGLILILLIVALGLWRRFSKN